MRGLIAEQCPQWALEALTFVDEGWDNVTWRLGTHRAVRIPRRSAAVELLRREQEWLPHLAPTLGVPVPVPLVRGAPGQGVPWIWSVVPWIHGVPAAQEALDGQGVVRVARVLGALHVPAPPEAPQSDLRGVPLRSRGDFMAARFDSLDALDHPGVGALRKMWDVGMEAPDASARVWLHGDLHPRNVLVRGGSLAGIIDWGDLTAGDAATDLSAAWMLCGTADGRRRFWKEYGAGADLVCRARAWAVFFGVALTVSGEKRHENMGRSVLAALLRDEAEG